MITKLRQRKVTLTGKSVNIASVDGMALLKKVKSMLQRKLHQSSVQKHKRLIKTVWSLLCVCGFILQVTIISMQYFSYEMINYVILKFPDEYQPPSTTICFYTIELLRWPLVNKTVIENMGFGDMSTNYDKIIRTVNNLGHHAKLQKETHFTNNTLIGDAHRLTYDFSDIFYKCGAMNADNYTIQYDACDAYFNVTTFFKGAFKCFTFSLDDQALKYNYQMLQLAKTVPGYQYAIFMHENATTVIGGAVIFIHGQGTLPREASDRWLHITDLDRLVGECCVIITSLRHRMISLNFRDDAYRVPKQATSAPVLD